MSGRFDGKVALVTGATSGIGRVTAELFAKEGAKVAVTGRRQELGDLLVREIADAGGEAVFFRGDASKEDHIKAAVSGTVERFGRLDIAFNNAGVEGALAPTVEQTEDNYRHVMDINVLGVLLSMKHQIPAMMKTGGGSIINNASIAGLIGMAGGTVYFASKHAVIGLTKCAALEVARSNIRVNAVAPGAIETEMYERFTGGDAGAQEQFKSLHPVGRAGRSEEVAEAVLYLASDAASFTTGVTLPVDGGFVAQ